VDSSRRVLYYRSALGSISEAVAMADPVGVRWRHRLGTGRSHPDSRRAAYALTSRESLDRVPRCATQRVTKTNFGRCFGPFTLGEQGASRPTNTTRRAARSRHMRANRRPVRWTRRHTRLSVCGAPSSGWAGIRSSLAGFIKSGRPGPEPAAAQRRDRRPLESGLSKNEQRKSERLSRSERSKARRE
jgi:hypothetical protein